VGKEKERDREIRIVDRMAPRIAIQISEISGRRKNKGTASPVRRAPDGDESFRGRSKENYG
jgi:hypothetical protein